LHIVSFDVPYPDDYGGVIDVFHKIRHLHALGVGIILHCYQDGRNEQPELNKHALDVYYYPRSKNLLKLASSPPYMVSTRCNRDLLSRLKEDDHPVLLEGLHCTGFLEELAGERRHTIVRTHNVEHEYYRALAMQETSFMKRSYLSRESSKLEKYESILRYAGGIASISEKDREHFAAGFRNVFHLPPFHRSDVVTARAGAGTYCLYHGNLSVAENHKAAMWLLTEVMPKTNRPLIIAGNHPRHELIRQVRLQKNAELVSNPEQGHMEQLISHAHVHLLPTFQSTGIKLKLINALFSGRHIVINSTMMQPGLEKHVRIADSAEAFATALESCYQTAFSEEQLAERAGMLEQHFSNSRNAALLAEKLQL